MCFRMHWVNDLLMHNDSKQQALFLDNHENQWINTDSSICNSLPFGNIKFTVSRNKNVDIYQFCKYTYKYYYNIAIDKYW